MNRTLQTLNAVSLFSAAALCLMESPRTHAQGASAEDAASSEALQEVTVSARYRDENLQTTPIAITAITAVDMQQRGFSTAADIAYTVPNASFRPSQGLYGNSMSAFIRGIGQYDFQPEFEPGVGVYFDDVLYPVVMGSMVDLMDLERVEVLRGPQGTLFGRGAIGGAIRYVSKKPQGDDSGNISLTYGRFDRVDIRGTYDFSIAENLFARVTGVSKQSNGYQDVYDFACVNPAQAGTLPVIATRRTGGCKLGTQGGTDVTGARASLRYVPSDSLELSLSADYMDDASEARADALLNVTGPAGPFAVWSEHYLLPTYGVRFDSRFVPDNPRVSYATYADPRSGLAYKPVNTLEQNGISGKVDWKLSDQVRAELITSYREFDAQFAADVDASPINEQTVDGAQKFDARTAELRFSGRLLDRADWTMGGFFYKGHFDSIKTSSLPAFAFAGVYGAIVGNPPSTDPAVIAAAEAAAANTIENVVRLALDSHNVTQSKNQSAFAHVVYDLSPKVSVSGGVRYSKDRKAENFDNKTVVTSATTTDNHFDWKIGLDYKFTDSIMSYLSASTGYRPQAFNPRPFQRNQFVKIDGEEARSYEMGLKGDFIDHRLRANVAAFYIDYAKRIAQANGTECRLGAADPGFGPPVYDTVPAGTPGSTTDTLGNVCLTTRLTSRVYYGNSPGKIKGAELEITARPVAALTVSGSYGYTDFNADDLQNPLFVSELPIYVPKQNWSLTAAYEFGFATGSTLTPRLDAYGQSEICTDLRSALSCSAGFELLNARLEWASSKRSWTAAVGATNLTNEDYFYNKFDFSTLGQPTTEGQPGRPREWYVTVTRQF